MSTVPLPFEPKPYLITVTLCFPNLVFSRRNKDEGCMWWRKATTHLGISIFPVKPSHPAGDSLTTYIPTDLFHLRSENLIIGACEMRSRTELVCCSEGLRFTGASPEAGTETTSDLLAALFFPHATLSGS